MALPEAAATTRFDWPEVLLRRFSDRFPFFTEETIKVEEFKEDGTMVVRAELPGIDPDEDVELTVANGYLTLHAERHEEKKEEEKERFIARVPLRVVHPSPSVARRGDRRRREGDLRGRDPRGPTADRRREDRGQRVPITRT